MSKEYWVGKVCLTWKIIFKNYNIEIVNQTKVDSS